MKTYYTVDAYKGKVVPVQGTPIDEKYVRLANGEVRHIGDVKPNTCKLRESYDEAFGDLEYV